MANSTKISEYSTTAANNTSIDSIDIDENCAASGINNAIRSVLKHQADAFTQGTPIALDQTNNRVGIGTTAPSAAMHIISGSDNANTLLLADTTTDSTIVDGFVTSRHATSAEEPVLMIQGRSTGSANEVLIGGTHNNTTYNTATSVKFYTASSDTSTTPSERMVINSSGNVGIGTTSPGYPMELASSSGAGTQFGITYVPNSVTLLLRAGGGDVNVGSVGSHPLLLKTGNTERMRIDNNGRVGIGDSSPDSMLKVQSVAAVTGNAQLTYFYDSQNRIGNYRQAAHASFSNYMNLMYTNRSGSSAFDFMRMASAGAGDNEFRFRGDGQAYADGSWNGGGADYAEYFEWDDSNSSDEDRRGYSVVLVGNKIRKATSSDAASDIIGVISATPAVTGDAAWERWEGKYLTDDYGSYLKEAYTATAWTETDADGAETHHYYETDKIPADVTVPADAVVTSTEEDGSLLMRRRLNPDFDDTQTYVPREERQEWDTVGLMGKLRLRAGQPTGDRWIKMRDIATDDDGNVTVEEWLVR